MLTMESKSLNMSAAMKGTAPAAAATPATSSLSAMLTPTVHLIVEALVIGGLAFMMNRRLKQLENETEQLKVRLQQQEQRSQDNLKHIKELYALVDSLRSGSGRREDFIPMRPTTPMQHPAQPQRTQHPQGQFVNNQQQVQQQHQQQRMAQQGGGMPGMPGILGGLGNMGDMMGTILSIAPTMMSTFMTPNTANDVIIELAKPMEKDAVKANVEIVNEDDDDPDVAAALHEDQLPSIAEEEYEDEK